MPHQPQADLATTTIDVQHPHLLSKKDPIGKSFVPHLTPSHNSSALPYLHWVMLNQMVPINDFCSYLFAFEGSASISSANSTLDDFLVVADTGCSITCTNDINDFEPNTYTTAHLWTLMGIASGLIIAGTGYVNWNFHDTNGQPVTIQTHVVHVPDIPLCLLLPQQIVDTTCATTNNHYLGTPTGLVIAYSSHLIHFPYDPLTNLPMLQTIPVVQHYYAFFTQTNLSAPHPLCPMPYYAQAL